MEAELGAWHYKALPIAVSLKPLSIRAGESGAGDPAVAVLAVLHGVVGEPDPMFSSASG